jgi:endonuclease III
MIEKSPFNLLQEIYYPDAWKILVVCMFLNQTGRKQVDMVRDEFFEKYPNASKCVMADYDEMVRILTPMGFQNKRSSAIIRMSREYMNMKWEKASDLYGIGKYANDSYEIFINHNLDVEPDDHILNKYLPWRKSQEFRKNI